MIGEREDSVSSKYRIIYIYIYMCVCVCVCIYICIYSKRSFYANRLLERIMDSFMFYFTGEKKPNTEMQTCKR